MGFTPPRTVYTLDFEGTELDGLVVKASSVSVDALLRFTAMADIAERFATGDPSKVGPEAMREVGELLTSFAAVLREWNMTDDAGSAVPPTVEGLRSLEFRHAMLIITTWTKAASDVPAPLSIGSTDGASSVELSIPMDTPSASRAS